LPSLNRQELLECGGSATAFPNPPAPKTQPSAKRLRYCFRHAFLPSNRRTNDGDGNKRVIAAPSLAVILRSEATKDLLLARTSPEARAFNPLPPPSKIPSDPHQPEKNPLSASVCTYTPSNHRVIMHRFRLKKGRQSGQEGATMHHAVRPALQIPVDTTPEILITASAIRNPRNSIKTKSRHDF
jgi:hypothetical protein